MFRRRIEKPLLFVFPAESRAAASIHSFFVFFPFDAVFLNSRKEVVDVRRVEPFTPLITPAKPAKYLIEMRAGDARRRGMRIGKRLGLPVF